MKAIVAILATTVVSVALSSAPAASMDSQAEQSAASRASYGLQAEKVARAGNCKNIRNRSDGGRYAHSALVCDLRGHRVNILTFKSEDQEVIWLALTCAFFPKQWIAVARGAVVTAKDGNRAATKAARKVYGMLSVRCDLWLDSRSHSND